MQRVIAVLVVSCPCAIGLAFPLADELATVALRRAGVFVRETDLWPRLGRIRRPGRDDRRAVELCEVIVERALDERRVTPKFKASVQEARWMLREPRCR